MKKRTVNPLIKRIPKELIGDWKKYLIVFAFLVLTIGFVSGMYVANESMMKAADESVTKYDREDGHFEWSEKADTDLIKDVESGEQVDMSAITGKEEEDASDVPVIIYENFFRNEKEDNNNDGKNDGTVRVFAKTDNINLACVLDGRLPENENEIAVDRMHADNVDMKVGDTIRVDGEKFEVVGLIAYVNYSTLHEKTTDLMFDAIKFDVAMVTDEGFDRLGESIHYAYAWKYKDAPADEKEEQALSDDFRKVLAAQTMLHGNELKDYVPSYGNPAINFATDDMGSDMSMGGVILDILIIIIAFIFGVTISNTITKESSTIGTLRAAGYTRGELVRDYLSMPVIVTFLAAIVGNILGYTVFKNVVVGMYYNSYSLPTYETVWNPDAFVKTTVVPIILMFVVNLIVIVRLLRHTPLQFLRHDLKKSKRKKAIRVPHWTVMPRFRVRIRVQNISIYLMLFVGICFIMVMLAMAVGMPDTLTYYQKHASNLMFTKYQYVLKTYQNADGSIVTTDNEDAENFAMKSLVKRSDALDEEISTYGVVDDSRYIEISDLESLEKNEVYISNSYADKYGIAIGDTIKLEEKYTDDTYNFKVCGIYEKCQSIAVFMPISQYRKVFDLDDDAFSGFFSDSKITDIDSDMIASTITKRDITKMCDQLDHSMGSYMQYFQVLCILLSMAMIYLLTKLIIEKNENAISMTKILGYENREIASLYLLSTTIVMLVINVLTVAVGVWVMNLAWKEILMTYSGWFSFHMETISYVKMFAFVLIGYVIVMILDFQRIKKIPMDQALKNVE